MLKPVRCGPTGPIGQTVLVHVPQVRCDQERNGFYLLFSYDLLSTTPPSLGGFRTRTQTKEDDPTDRKDFELCNRDEVRVLTFFIAHVLFWSKIFYELKFTCLLINLKTIKLNY